MKGKISDNPDVLRNFAKFISKNSQTSKRNEYLKCLGGVYSYSMYIKKVRILCPVW